MSPLAAVALALAAGYLLGSIPTSIIVGRLFFRTDIRAHGSGNAGGTNTFRVFGWKAGVFVSAFDVGKGAAAALLGAALGRSLGASLAAAGAPAFPAWAAASEVLGLSGGVAAVAGHVWTVFAGFRGGKGVACAGGLLLALAPLPFLAAAAVFALLLGIFGIVSLASVGAALAFPVALTVAKLAGAGVGIPLLGAAWLLGPFIAWTHRTNLRRLAKGEEKSFPKLRVIGRLFDR
ncbi:MAG TPA: glycerol-3-phosphate 1-O-acyltransferase PlsY [Spirochaetales bacterium]|nr:glycerol-3-phosphate 1-O-acyltransferase PlsY [Spirochaetales bacterium]